MDKIHTLNEIIERMCRHTGCSEREAADFISAVTDEVTTRLKAHQENIEVPGLGSFGVDRQGYVVFTPAQEIAAEVNEPFSLFESVMLEPGVTAEELAGVEAENYAPHTALPEDPEEQKPVEQENPVPAVISEPSPAEVEYKTQPTQPDETFTTHEESVSEESITEKPISTQQTIPANPVSTVKEEVKEATGAQLQVADYSPAPESNDDYDSYPEYQESLQTGRHGFNPVIAYILGIVTGFLVCCVLVYFLYPKLMNDSIDAAYGVTSEEYADDEDVTDNVEDTTASFTSDVTEEELQPEPAATIPAPQPTPPAATTEPAKKADNDVVYDTVRPGYFLTKIAQKHYGVQEFWVYIYEENKDRIANPMKLPAGFKVVIPPAEKYGINPNDPASVEKAKNISHELNRKFR